MRIIRFFIAVLSLLACETEDRTTVNSHGARPGTFWAVDTNAMSGTRIREAAFPVVQDAAYVAAEDVSLPHSACVFVFSQGDRLLVYPARYMGIEVVNEQLAGSFFSITYCPLTQSALAWNRLREEDILTFSASGLLYKENLVLYDLETRSLWSQMLVKGIHGHYVNQRPGTFPLLELRFGAVARHFPEAKVFNGNYAGVEGQRKNLASEEPDEGTGERETLYEEGSKVFGIVQQQSVITMSHEARPQEVGIQRVQNMVIVSSKAQGFITAFFADERQLEPLQDAFPYILQGREGMRYDVFGRPEFKDETERLKRPLAFSALWWAWADFYDTFVPMDE